MRGGKYLALDRGVFDDDAREEAAPPAQADTSPARVALYEAAAAHDGQPANDWLRVFLWRWNAEIE